VVKVENLPILVVDDDPTIRSTIAEFLSDEGFVVLTADNGVVALDLVTRHNLGVILLDLRMPIMDGWSFAKSLRERGLHIPIVVMTAERGGAEWARQLQAAGHVAKPFDLDDLLRALDGVNVRRHPVE
jgi:CheY-like chemotaxis protein